MNIRLLFPTFRPCLRTMDRRVLPLIVGSLFLPQGCGGDPSLPTYMRHGAPKELE